MLSICTTYLLMEDIDNRDLVNESQKSAALADDYFRSLGPYFDGHEDGDGDGSAGSAYEERFLDPVGQGFGPFFTYAANFWTSHLQLTPDGSLPSTGQLRKLCAHRSKRFANWCDQYLRPDCTRGLRPLGLLGPFRDILDIAARFGPASLLREIVEESDFGDHDSPYQDPLVDTLEVLLYNGSFEKAKILFEHPSLHNKRFFHRALECYRRISWGPLRRPLDREWDSLFELVHSIAGSLTRDNLGNTLLCEAAASFCVPLLRHLLDASKKNSAVMEAVLTPRPEPPGAGMSNVWEYHQSIARAARFGQTDTVETLKFLLRWPGIESHFLHRDSFGYNVFHVVAQSKGSPETLEVLLRHSTAGVNGETVEGATPLDLYVFSPSCNPECVRLLLEVGGADVRGGLVSLSPLRQAAMNGNEAVCRLLVTVGKADPRSALSSNAGQPPRLLAGIAGGSIDEEEHGEASGVCWSCCKLGSDRP